MQSVHSKAFVTDKYFKDNPKVQKSSYLLMDINKVDKNEFRVFNNIASPICHIKYDWKLPVFIK